MNIEKNKIWIRLAFCGLIISLVSLLFPIIVYTSYRDHTAHSFNLIGLLTGGFAEVAQREYTGKSWIELSTGAFDVFVAIAGIIGAASIVLSLVGLRSMSKQYESQRPFRMTLCGLIGTAIPALLLLLAFGLSTNYYQGEVSLGAYVVITPLAMIASCLAVVKRHQLTRAELALQKEASQYIRVAGDLPEQQ